MAKSGSRKDTGALLTNLQSAADDLRQQRRTIFTEKKETKAAELDERRAAQEDRRLGILENQIQSGINETILKATQDLMNRSGVAFVPGSPTNAKFENYVRDFFSRTGNLDVDKLASQAPSDLIPEPKERKPVTGVEKFAFGEEGAPPALKRAVAPIAEDVAESFQARGAVGALGQVALAPGRALGRAIFGGGDKEVQQPGAQQLRILTEKEAQFRQGLIDQGLSPQEADQMMGPGELEKFAQSLIDQGMSPEAAIAQVSPGAVVIGAPQPQAGRTAFQGGPGPARAGEASMASGRAAVDTEALTRDLATDVDSPAGSARLSLQAQAAVAGIVNPAMIETLLPPRSTQGQAAANDMILNIMRRPLTDRSRIKIVEQLKLLNDRYLAGDVQAGLSPQQLNATMKKMEPLLLEQTWLLVPPK